MNWLLLSQIHSIFETLEDNCNWDLDNLEMSKLVKSVYYSVCDKKHNFIKPYFTNMLYYKTMLEKARIDCWGKDNECRPLTHKEINIFYTNLCSDVRQQCRELISCKLLGK